MSKVTVSNSNLPLQGLSGYPQEIFDNISQCLSVRDLGQFLFVCKAARDASDTTLRFRAREYGYPSQNLPSSEEAKPFLAALIKVVNALKEMGLLSKSELCFSNVAKDIFIFNWNSQQFDPELTLMNIRTFTFERIAELYSDPNFF